MVFVAVAAATAAAVVVTVVVVAGAAATVVAAAIVVVVVVAVAVAALLLLLLLLHSVWASTRCMRLSEKKVFQKRDHYRTKRPLSNTQFPLQETMPHAFRGLGVQRCGRCPVPRPVLCLAPQLLCRSLQARVSVSPCRHL